MSFDVFNAVVHAALLEVGIDVRARHGSFRKSKSALGSVAHLSPDGATTGGLRLRTSLAGMRGSSPDSADTRGGMSPAEGRRNSFAAPRIVLSRRTRGRKKPRSQDVEQMKDRLGMLT